MRSRHEAAAVGLRRVASQAHRLKVDQLPNS